MNSVVTSLHNSNGIDIEIISRKTHYKNEVKQNMLELINKEQIDTK